ESGRIADCAVSASLADTDAFWQLRHSIPELLAGLKPTVNFDCGLPWAEMEGFVDRVNAAMRARYPDAAGHLGDNNIHLMSGPHRVEDLHAVEAQVYAQLRGREGTISAEHGIGFIKNPFLDYTRSAAELDFLRCLKAALNPRNILNPGRVLD